MAHKVFLDTNIFLDHLLERNDYSSLLLRACEQGEVVGYASSASFYTLAYVVRKSLSLTETRKLLGNYLRFITVLPTQKDTLRSSFDASFDDLEDAFQYFTALKEEDIEFFITNNLKDFQKASQQIEVINAKKFVTEYLD